MSKAVKPTNVVEPMATVIVPVISEQDQHAMRTAGGVAIDATSNASAILKSASVDTRKSPLCLAYQALFYEGALMIGCTIDVAEAKRRLALGAASNAKLKPEEKRDDATETIYGAAKTQWSRVCDGAGLPKLHIGGNRGANDKSPAETPKAHGLDIVDFHVPNDLDTAGALSLFDKFATAMAKIIDANAARIVGDAGSVLRQTVIDTRESIADATAALARDHSAAKPSTAMLAQMRAEIAAELKAEMDAARQAKSEARVAKIKVAA